MIQKLSDRFDELLNEMNEIESQDRTIHKDGRVIFLEIDHTRLFTWKVKAKNLIRQSCGQDSEHFKEFVNLERLGSGQIYSNTLWKFRSVFIAAKDDYQDGLMHSNKMLVQAEVFYDQLEQAKELLNSNYYLAAAVVAGVVLETELRNLCNHEGIDVGSLNKMNDALAKAGIYNKFRQKQITAIAHIRNSAAHGNKEEFKPGSVEGMIRDIEQFLAGVLVT